MRIVKVIGILLIVVIIKACVAKHNLAKEASAPFYSMEELAKHNLVGVGDHYKRNYPGILSYFLDNKKGVFKKKEGEFHVVNLYEDHELMMACDYFERYGALRSGIVYIVALPGGDDIPLKGIPIKVVSTKHGEFVEQVLENDEVHSMQQRRMFFKPLSIKDSYEAIKLVARDTVKVSIGTVNYQFINPEVKLH